MNQQHSTFPRRDSRNEEEKDIASLVLDNQHHQYSLGEDVHISEVLTESNGTHENGATTVLPSIMSEEFGKDILQREVAPQMFPGMAPILAPMYSHLPYNPSALEDAPLYVNAKQYNRILKRRQARARLESNHMILPRKDKPFIHASRHNWAVERKRGPGGRFLSKEEMRRIHEEEAQGKTVKREEGGEETNTTSTNGKLEFEDLESKRRRIS